MLLNGDIHVTVLRDTNGNGSIDPGDAPLAGWTVFLDDNTNGAPDGGEASRVTDAGAGSVRERQRAPRAAAAHRVLRTVHR